MGKKTFVVTFPICGGGRDRVTIDAKELAGKTEQQIKELLYDKAGPPSVCNYCSRNGIEEIEIDGDRVGDDLSNVNFFEEDEDGEE